MNPMRIWNAFIKLIFSAFLFLLFCIPSFIAFNIKNVLLFCSDLQIRSVDPLLWCLMTES